MGVVGMNQSILLSFDLEEFDIPEEYGQIIEDTVKFAVFLNGLKSILSLLDKLNIQSIYFFFYSSRGFY